MPREDVQTKGRRYVLESRLTVHVIASDRVRATCKGQGEHYSLGWDPGPGWWCGCMARTRCCHLVALQLVTVRPGVTSR
jgi:hypothetical protein